MEISRPEHKKKIKLKSSSTSDEEELSEEIESAEDVDVLNEQAFEKIKDWLKDTPTDEFIAWLEALKANAASPSIDTSESSNHFDRDKGKGPASIYETEDTPDEVIVPSFVPRRRPHRFPSDPLVKLYSNNVSLKDYTSKDDIERRYTSNDVDFLLQHYVVKNDIFEKLDILSATTYERLLIILAKGLTGFNKNQPLTNRELAKRKVIIPIDVNNNYWVLIYFIYSENKSNPTQIYYFDLLGLPLPEDLMNILKDEDIFPKSEIITMPFDSQSESYNCGPWIIEIAHDITYGKPPLISYDLDAARRKHQDILDSRTKSYSPPKTSSDSGQSTRYDNPTIPKNTTFFTNILHDSSEEINIIENDTTRMTKKFAPYLIRAVKNNKLAVFEFISLLYWSDEKVRVLSDDKLQVEMEDLDKKIFVQEENNYIYDILTYFYQRIKLLVKSYQEEFDEIPIAKEFGHEIKKQIIEIKKEITRNLEQHLNTFYQDKELFILKGNVIASKNNTPSHLKNLKKQVQDNFQQILEEKLNDAILDLNKIAGIHANHNDAFFQIFNNRLSRYDMKNTIALIGEFERNYKISKKEGKIYINKLKIAKKFLRYENYHFDKITEKVEEIYLLTCFPEMINYLPEEFYCCSIEKVYELMDVGIALNDVRETSTGNTLLHIAIIKYAKNLTDKLLLLGIDPLVRNKSNKSSLSLALEKDKAEILFSILTSLYKIHHNKIYNIEDHEQLFLKNIGDHLLDYGLIVCNRKDQIFWPFNFIGEDRNIWRMRLDEYEDYWYNYLKIGKNCNNIGREYTTGDFYYFANVKSWPKNTEVKRGILRRSSLHTTIHELCDQYNVLHQNPALMLANEKNRLLMNQLKELQKVNQGLSHSIMSTQARAKIIVASRSEMFNQLKLQFTAQEQKFKELIQQEIELSKKELRGERKLSTGTLVAQSSSSWLSQEAREEQIDNNHHDDLELNEEMTSCKDEEVSSSENEENAEEGKNLARWGCTIS